MKTFDYLFGMVFGKRIVWVINLLSPEFYRHPYFNRSVLHQRKVSQAANNDDYTIELELVSALYHDFEQTSLKLQLEL